MRTPNDRSGPQREPDQRRQRVGDDRGKPSAFAIGAQFEGEQVLGAQQNRIFDGSVLVAARASLEVPVSCVERGRWDGRRHGERLSPSPHMSDAHLRRLKRARINTEGHADQAEAWLEIGHRLVAFSIESPSEALSEVYTGRRDDLQAMAREIRHEDGQVGALACVAGRPTALDLVSRSEVFASLLAPLAQGYALDAPSVTGEGPVDRRAAEEFLKAAFTSNRSRRATPGLGEGFALAAPALWAPASNTAAS